jgi:Protein of unknown function (DUF3168)
VFEDSMSPEKELQGEIVNLLRTTPAVTDLVDMRVYDAVPDNREFPCISMGPTISVSEEVDCIDSINITMQIDVWSRESGFPEVKEIADVVRKTVNQLEDLQINALVRLSHTMTNTMRDPDGLTSHSALLFTAMVERVE